MRKLQESTPDHDTFTLDPDSLESEPLELSQLLNLILLAHETGYTVRAAHDMKLLQNPILADIYTVWFAIENELHVYAHNIPRLMEFTRLKHSSFS